MKASAINFMTFDIEDYYHIFDRNFLGRSTQPCMEVERNTDLILNTLEIYNTHATFFVVGKVAEKYPDLVKRIESAGHEVASHGHEHIYANQVTPDIFREDLNRSIGTLGEITGFKPLGFRAPQFSVDGKTPWAFEIMAELGLRYDSSLFPGRNFNGRQASVTPFEITVVSGKIIEVPLSAVRIGGRYFPVGGGGFLRLFPFCFNQWAMDHIIRNGDAAVVYMHPYEFETHPRPIDYDSVGLKQRTSAWLMHARQLVNRSKSIEKLKLLLQRYRFTNIADAYDLEH